MHKIAELVGDQILIGENRFNFSLIHK